MSPARRPDVVVVVLDTARTFDVSAVWEDAPETTPALAALAAESLVFPQATTTSPWTLPAHASMFTGLMPSRHGAHELSMRLAADGPPTLAELLAAEGYETVGVCCNDLVGPTTGLTRGYRRFIEERDALPGGLDHTLAERLTGSVGLLRRRAEGLHRRRRMARDHGGARATRLVERVLRDVPADRPLHLFVNYLESHLPYRPPDADALRYLPDTRALATARALNQSPLDHATGAAPHPESDWRLLRGLYRGAVRYVDRLLGEVLDMLRAAGRLDGALVVVTSDHGENIGDHGMMDHQYSLNDTVLRVPLVVRLPGGVQRGRRDDQAQLIDLLPTVCEVTGVAAPPTQGVTLTGPVTRTHTIAEYLAPHVILAELKRSRPHIDWSRFDRGLRSIRSAQRKYVAASDGVNELYDLAADPYEGENLFGGHPDEVTLARALRRWEQTEGAVALGGGASVDPAVTERLTALGYIE